MQPFLGRLFEPASDEVQTWRVGRHGLRDREVIVLREGSDQVLGNTLSFESISLCFRSVVVFLYNQNQRKEGSKLRWDGVEELEISCLLWEARERENRAQGSGLLGTRRSVSFMQESFVHSLRDCGLVGHLHVQQETRVRDILFGSCRKGNLLLSARVNCLRSG